MNKTKDCKVYFSTLIKRMWKSKKVKKEVNLPLDSIDEIIKFIKKRKKTDRYYDLKDDKFCFLATATIFPENNSAIIINGFFKSSRDNFRPNVLHKSTGLERANPKNKGEGDIEKTHFVMKIDKAVDEVYLFLECNGNGINTNNLINYISHFNSLLLTETKSVKNYSIKHLIIPKNDFLMELENLSRANMAEIYISKKILGGNALNLSNRTTQLKHDVKLIVSASPKETATEFIVDCFNGFKTNKNDISKIRVYGNDENKNEIIIDTSFMSKIEYVTVDINQDTGEVNSSQLFTGLTQIANSF